jgi:competence ComEA-like helix-hairpin-helix protein
MRQVSQALCARSLHVCFLAPLLTIALFSSCVERPRQFIHVDGQSRSHVSERKAKAAPLIDINTALPTELEKLPGIGRGLAARIVAFREQYGRFRRPEHLMLVRGISVRRFRAMQPLITAE